MDPNRTILQCLEHYVKYEEQREDSKEKVLTSSDAIPLIEDGINRINHRKNATLYSNCEGKFKKLWVELDDITIAALSMLETGNQLMKTRGRLWGMNTTYFQLPKERSSILLGNVQSEIRWCYFIRAVIYILVLLPNLVAAYAPDSEATKAWKSFNEVIRNAFSVMCALILTQFLDSNVRGNLKDLDQVKKSAQVIQRTMQFIYQMLDQSKLVDVFNYKKNKKSSKKKH